MMCPKITCILRPMKSITPTIYIKTRHIYYFLVNLFSNMPQGSKFYKPANIPDPCYNNYSSGSNLR